MGADHHWAITAGLVTSSLIAVTANLLLLIVFCRRRGLRTISNRFVINLLFTNLLSSISLIPLLLIDQELNTTHNTSHNLTVSSSNLGFPDLLDIPAQESVVLEEQEEVIEDGSSYFERVTEILITNKISESISDTTSDKLELMQESTELVASFRNNNTNQSFSLILCYIAQSSTSLVCTASILSILLIGLDQYFAVIHSLRYHAYINKFKSILLIAISWVIAIVFGVLGALTKSESNVWRFCIKEYTNSPHSSTSTNSSLKILNTIYAICYFAVIIVMPFVAICVIYICIYRAAHKNSARMRKSTATNSYANLHLPAQLTEKTVKAPSDNELNVKKEEAKPSLPKVHSAPSFTNFQVSCETKRETEVLPTVIDVRATVTRTHSDRSNFINALKHRISNASVFRYREETRAAKISVLVIFMVLICYVPYGLALVLNSGVINLATPLAFNYLSLTLLVVSNILSPFLFAYRNRRVQREIIKFYGCKPAKSVNKFVSANHRELGRRKSSLVLANLKHKSVILEEGEKTDNIGSGQPFLHPKCVIPQVIVTCKLETEKPDKKSILKRVCSGKTWGNYKKCSFITVPDSCLSPESARGSFSSASTQTSSDE